MRPWLVALLLSVTVADVVASEHTERPPDPAVQKELVDEAKSFLKTARSSLEKWDRLPDQLGKTVYFAGVRDGALGAMLLACGLGFVILRLRKP